MNVEALSIKPAGSADDLKAKHVIRLLNQIEVRAALDRFSAVALKLTVEETMPPLKIRMRVARGSDVEIIPIAPR